MKVYYLLILILGMISSQLCAQKLKYDDSLDSLWSKNTYIKSTSNDGNWVLISEHSDYKPILYKVANTKGLKSFNLGNCLSAEISTDSKLVAFLTSDSELKILNLENGNISSLGQSEKYGFNHKGNVLAFIKETKNHKTLVLRDFSEKKEEELVNVSDFFWNPMEDIIIGTKITTEKVKLIKIFPFKDFEIVNECFNCKFSQIKWSDTGKFFTYLKKDENDKNQIYFVNNKGLQKSISDSIVNKIFPHYKIGDWYLEISKNGKKVFFYRENENYKVRKEENLQIWNTDDTWIYPREKSYEYQKRLLLSLWKTESNEIIKIEDEINSSSFAHPEMSFALIFDKKKYEPKYEHYPYADIYMLDLNTGNKDLIIKYLYVDPSFISISPNGNYISYFKDKNWWLYNIIEKTNINLTEGINVDWTISRKVRIKNTHLVEVPFWTIDNKYILFHDQHDIWQISIDGKHQKRLTSAKEANTTYQIYSNKNKKENLKNLVKGVGLSCDLNKPILMQTWDENLKTGVSIWRQKKGLDHLISYEGKINIHHFNQNSVIYSQNRFNEGPKFYRLDLETREKHLIHEVNPELEKYDLGHYEIFSYSTKDFQSLNGILIYPSEYNSSVQYPMIVWPYEKNTVVFHKYLPPTDRNDFNIYKYIHNGYFILLPDIDYKIGQPGFSALACIVAAVNKATEINSSINRNKLGLYGFSYGGYEAAFISTQTNLFKAVVAGAAATDLVSFYHDIWWELERAQAWRLESQQFRMGDSYYSLKKEYQLNSPLFHVEKLETPLLLWTGKLDSNVNWYQSVFMYSAMRRLKKPGRLIIFNDEGHSLIKPENQERLSKEVFDWFECYLK